MQMQVQLLLPGSRAAPVRGQTIGVVQYQIRTEDNGGTECIVVVADLRLRWRSTALAADRAAVLLQGAVDLVLRWPFPAAQVTTYVEGQKVDSQPVGLSAKSPHEIVRSLRAAFRCREPSLRSTPPCANA
jgi:hypothetical protein